MSLVKTGVKIQMSYLQKLTVINISCFCPRNKQKKHKKEARRFFFFKSTLKLKQNHNNRCMQESKAWVTWLFRWPWKQHEESSTLNRCWIEKGTLQMSRVAHDTNVWILDQHLRSPHWCETEPFQSLWECWGLRGQRLFCAQCLITWREPHGDVFYTVRPISSIVSNRVSLKEKSRSKILQEGILLPEAKKTETALCYLEDFSMSRMNIQLI